MRGRLRFEITNLIEEIVDKKVNFLIQEERKLFSVILDKRLKKKFREELAEEYKQFLKGEAQNINSNLINLLSIRGIYAGQIKDKTAV